MCRAIYKLGYFTYKTCSVYKQFSTKDVDSPWPADILKLTTIACKFLQGRESLAYLCSIKFALKYNLITKPVADSLVDNCESITASIDQFELLQFVKELPLGVVLFKLLRTGLILSLTSRMILDAIRFSKPEYISSEKYKLIDPLTTREHHGETYVQHLVRLIEDVCYKTSDSVCNDRYHPVAKGLAILGLGCLYIVRKQLKTYYFLGA